MLLAREHRQRRPDPLEWHVTELDADREIELVALSHGLVGAVAGEIDVAVREEGVRVVAGLDDTTSTALALALLLVGSVLVCRVAFASSDTSVAAP
ncbi:hypothetical protein OG352_18655 [Streptomyces sp. NBC_01485]|uniref:hypothetical protein n=1 Tax=Streptomyces sp. NBC_01485 TaxID=2903884 RepID=UPI002E350168|nr:hypothetical protein [Streptomyces sp. NBC_01485]